MIQADVGGLRPRPTKRLEGFARCCPACVPGPGERTRSSVQPDPYHTWGDLRCHGHQVCRRPARRASCASSFRTPRQRRAPYPPKGLPPWRSGRRGEASVGFRPPSPQGRPQRLEAAVPRAPAQLRFALVVSMTAGWVSTSAHAAAGGMNGSRLRQRCHGTSGHSGEGHPAQARVPGRAHARRLSRREPRRRRCCMHRVGRPRRCTAAGLTDVFLVHELHRQPRDQCRQAYRQPAHTAGEPAQESGERAGQRVLGADRVRTEHDRGAQQVDTEPGMAPVSSSRRCSSSAFSLRRRGGRRA